MEIAPAHLCSVEAHACNRSKFVVSVTAGTDAVERQIIHGTTTTASATENTLHFILRLSRPSRLTADRFRVHIATMPADWSGSSRDLLYFEGHIAQQYLIVTFYTGWSYEYNDVAWGLWAACKLPHNVELHDENATHAALVWFDHIFQRNHGKNYAAKTWGGTYPVISVKLDDT